MARSIHRTKIGFLAALVLTAPAISLNFAYAANPQNVNFQVDIDEALTVSVTDPTTWANGDINELLRNKVNVSATTNNGIGVTVSMYTNNTELRNLATYNSQNAATYIPTLAAATTAAAFPVNYWGYSLNDTDGGSDSANYNALTTSATQLFTTVGTQSVSTGQKDVYFGAKADDTKQAGTYAQTVYFAAVTGTIDSSNPAKPVNPSTPDPTNQVAHYSSTTGQTTYTTRTTAGTGDDSVTGSKDTTTTNVTDGDVTSHYAQAAGVTTSNNGSALAAVLAVSAGVAVISGTAFIVAAKNRHDDEEK